MIRIEGVSHRIGAAPILHDIDLTLEQGEFAALIGPSGSGKSTLLNIIGLLDRPTSGRVLLQGQDTRGLDEDALARLRARTLGFIFQFHHLMPAFTALENVIEGPIIVQGEARDTAIAQPLLVASALVAALCLARLPRPEPHAEAQATTS